MRLYLHSPGCEVAVLEAAEDSKLRDLFEINDALIFLEADEPVDVDLTLAEAIQRAGHVGRRHQHVHKHHCRRVEVGVNYGGVTKDVASAPSAVLEQVRSHAVRAFQIDPVTAATMVLRIPGKNADLPGSEHLSDLLEPDTCRVELNLVPSGREAG